MLHQLLLRLPLGVLVVVARVRMTVIFVQKRGAPALVVLTVAHFRPIFELRLRTIPLVGHLLSPGYKPPVHWLLLVRLIQLHSGQH